MLVFHTSDSFETVRNDLFSVKRFFDWDTASLRYAIGLTPAAQPNDPKYLQRRRATVCAQAVVGKLLKTTHLARSLLEAVVASCHFLGFSKCRSLVDKILKPIQLMLAL
jgi:hypothetical protein